MDARNAVFIMTSNLGANPSEKRKPLGFHAGADTGGEESASPVTAELKKYFLPELINRIDEVIVFAPLSPRSVETIAESRMKALAKSVEEKHAISLLFDNAVIKALCTEGYSVEFGARQLNRAIQKLIEIPLTQMLVNQPRSSIEIIRCSVESGVISLKTGRSA